MSLLLMRTSEYKKSNWSSDGNTQGTVTGISNSYWDTTVSSLEKAQVQKYNGFYVPLYLYSLYMS